MLPDHSGLSRTERLLTLFTRVRPGEGRSLLLFFAHAFLLLFSYYVVKALREAFLLSQFSAEVRAYAVAVIAALLMIIVPAYGLVRRRLDGARLLRAVIVFFALNLLVFAAVARSGTRIGFAFFVWVSIFGVMVPAQFWAFAADALNLKTGQRLFPLIMVGGNLGALAGAKCAHLAVASLTPVGLMLVATTTLLLTVGLSGPAAATVPEGSRAVSVEHERRPLNLMGGLGLVFRERYLLLIALLVVLLNWINSTGEYILADLVSRNADEQVAASGGALAKSFLITAFYGDFQFWFTLLGVLIQLFLVFRVYRWVGVAGALLVLPVIAALGYGLIVFIPIFSLIRLVKIAENSVDYSLMNTTRQALFLPVSRDAKYEGKTAIDTFFWRCGDLIQAGVVYAGLHWLRWTAAQFATLNLALALIWIAVAIAIGREFKRLAQKNVTNVAPEAARPIEDLHYQPGQPFRHVVASDCFLDADPGDVLRLRARLADGSPLPSWMRFDMRHRAFIGVVPAGVSAELTVMVVASDVDGMEAASCFRIRCVT
ncbi:MAG TPA: Npt1/Npt2 family nucleotide transporter [Myxococcales bacterium]|nr:Npt1/Npt2 family nucleotide transporter [Myxococcales bacterium]